jgi:uncharacterized membrane protein
MAWYTILFITVASLFALKMIVSIFLGDIDMDVDFDGDSDFDSSSAFSFKGIIHFLVGFSGYLFARAHTSTVNIVDGNVQFSFADFAWAIIVGIVTMIALFYAYKLAMKANNSTKDPEDLIDNSKGTIYINLGNGQYSVEAHTHAGTTNVTATYENDKLTPGTNVTLIKEDNKIKIIM